jgi:hypothetical protein
VAVSIWLRWPPVHAGGRFRFDAGALLIGKRSRWRGRDSGRIGHIQVEPSYSPDRHHSHIYIHNRCRRVRWPGDWTLGPGPWMRPGNAPHHAGRSRLVSGGGSYLAAHWAWIERLARFGQLAVRKARRSVSRASPCLACSRATLEAPLRPHGSQSSVSVGAIRSDRVTAPWGGAFQRRPLALRTRLNWVAVSRIGPPAVAASSINPPA